MAPNPLKITELKFASILLLALEAKISKRVYRIVARIISTMRDFIFVYKSLLSSTLRLKNFLPPKLNTD